MIKAIIYDFDGTLTPEPFPEFDILELSGLENGTHNPNFHEMVEKCVQAGHTEGFEAVILTIMSIMQKAGFRCTNENISFGAEKRQFNPGIKTYYSNTKRIWC